MKIFNTFLVFLLFQLSLLISAQSSTDPINDVCSYKKFPLIAGGNKDDYL